MASTQEFILHSSSYALAPDAFDETVKANFISTWDEVTDVLKERIYYCPDGDVIVSADWEEAKAVYIGSLNETLPQAYLQELYERKFDVPVKCVVSKPDTVRAGGHHFLDLFLYDFFLCLNLSAPGSCDFFSAYIDPPLIPRDIGQMTPDSHMELSGSLFEHLWETDIKANWGLIKHIPLRQVVEWLDSLKIGTRQIASSRMERSLFALLHLCRLDGAEPSDLVWLAHILEALYDTPKATITKSLQDRVCSVLAVPDEKKKSIRKHLREFYDARSQFVHGEIAITHPLENDFLDEEALSLQGYILDQLDFGAAVSIATFQQHIINNWREIIFPEIYQGVPIEKT